MELPIYLIMGLSEAGLGPKQTEPAEPVGGGMVASAARVMTDRGPIFVKWKEDAPERFFECEANGLTILRAAGPLRTPAVLVARDVSLHDRSVGWISFLALEWIDTIPPPKLRDFAIGFGQALAALHRETS